MSVSFYRCMVVRGVLNSQFRTDCHSFRADENENFLSVKSTVTLTWSTVGFLFHRLQAFGSIVSQ